MKTHLVEVNESLDYREGLQVGAAVHQHGQHVSGNRGIVPAAKGVVGSQTTHTEGPRLLVEKVHPLEQLQGGQFLRLKVKVRPQLLLLDQVPETFTSAGKGWGARLRVMHEAGVFATYLERL